MGPYISSLLIFMFSGFPDLRKNNPVITPAELAPRTDFGDFWGLLLLGQRSKIYRLLKRSTLWRSCAPSLSANIVPEKLLSMLFSSGIFPSKRWQATWIFNPFVFRSLTPTSFICKLLVFGRCTLQQTANHFQLRPHNKNPSPPQPPSKTKPHLANGPWNESLNFIFPTKYVIPKSLKFSHWPSKKLYTPQNQHSAWKWMVGKLLSFCGADF